MNVKRMFFEHNEIFFYIWISSFYQCTYIYLNLHRNHEIPHNFFFFIVGFSYGVN